MRSCHVLFSLWLGAFSATEMGQDRKDVIVGRATAAELSLARGIVERA
jgi:hypothetical protein